MYMIRLTDREINFLGRRGIYRTWDLANHGFAGSPHLGELSVGNAGLEFDYHCIGYQPRGICLI